MPNLLGTAPGLWSPPRAGPAIARSSCPASLKSPAGSTPVGKSGRYCSVFAVATFRDIAFRLVASWQIPPRSLATPRQTPAPPSHRRIAFQNVSTLPSVWPQNSHIIPPHQQTIVTEGTINPNTGWRLQCDLKASSILAH